MRLGVPVASPITAFAACCCLAERSLQPPAGALPNAQLSRARGHFARNRFRLIDPCDTSGLDRAASTVSREVTRHGGRSAYRALDADKQAWKSALRAKRCLLAGNRKLRELVVEVIGR
jgi:hypothetical protein